MHRLSRTNVRVIMDSTPSSLDGVILNKLKDTRRYHSGTISRGVDNPFDLHIISSGWMRDTPNIDATTPKISTGNMYKMSCRVIICVARHSR
jgi:hypothetical protein